MSFSESPFRLGQWTVWPRRCTIESDATSTHVKPKSMAVLVRLADADGDVVSRNDLLDSVWPGSDVTDDVRTHCIVELRKAFDDSREAPRVIENIPKRGYRLIAAVRST